MAQNYLQPDFRLARSNGVEYTIANRGAILGHWINDFNKHLGKMSFAHQMRTGERFLDGPLGNFCALSMEAARRSRPFFATKTLMRKAGTSAEPRAKEGDKARMDPYWFPILLVEPPITKLEAEEAANLDPGGSYAPFLENRAIIAVGFDKGDHWFAGELADGPVFFAKITGAPINMRQIIENGILHARQNGMQKERDTWMAFAAGDLEFSINGKTTAKRPGTLAVYSANDKGPCFNVCPECEIVAFSDALVFATGTLSVPFP